MKNRQPERLDPGAVDELIHAWKTTGDAAARNRVVVSYAPMVKYLATRKVRELPPHCDLDDLVSSGLLALIQAIDRYDPSRGNFQTYSWNRVSGAILDELRRVDWAPRSVRSSDRKINTAREAVQRRTGAMPTNRQVAQEMGMPVEELERRLRAVECSEVVSLHAKTSRQRGSSDAAPAELGSVVEADPTSSGDPELAALSRERTRVVRDAIDSLSTREKTILFLTYVEELSGAEVGHAVGVSESRVSQILSGVRQKLSLHVRRSDATELFDLAA